MDSLLITFSIAKKKMHLKYHIKQSQKRAKK